MIDCATAPLFQRRPEHDKAPACQSRFHESICGPLGVTGGLDNHAFRPARWLLIGRPTEVQALLASRYFSGKVVHQPSFSCAPELDACSIPRFFRRGDSSMHRVSSVTSCGASRLASHTTRMRGEAWYRSRGEMRFTGAASLRGSGSPFRAGAQRGGMPALLGAPGCTSLSAWLHWR